METRGGRGREGTSHARQGRSMGNQNRQLNCRRQSRLLCRPQPSQELPGKSGGEGGQSRWLNHRWRSRLATGAQFLRPGRGLDRSTLPTRLPRGRQNPERLFLLQLRLSRQQSMVVPVEQVAQKRKASSPLPPKTVTRPVSPPSLTRWEKARSRIRGRFREYISPPVENIADLPRKPASETWQVLPDEMGKVNIGLASRNNAILVICTCQGELFQQVVIDKTVDNATGHNLLRSLLGDGYRILLPCIVNLHNKYPWLQISDSSQ